MSSRTLTLPDQHGHLISYTLGVPSTFPSKAPPPHSRVVYTAAHIVANPLAADDAAPLDRIDWEATLAHRDRLWDLGFGVAEAMDTAQRGMGLDWEMARELIRLSAARARERGALIASGAGTDHLAATESATLDAIVQAYCEQCAFVESTGSGIILMASRALARRARGPADYLAVYRRVLANVQSPVIIHWLGPMFDPALVGYWGADSWPMALESCLAVLYAESDKISGIKLSMLHADYEIEMRRRLPAGMRMFTGDDFNFPSLIRGDVSGDQIPTQTTDQHSYSDALLGVLDGIAPIAAAAMAALDVGDANRFMELLSPTLPLGRHLFGAPTQYYKTGLTLLAFLNGYQSHFRMVGGQESARSILHLAQVLRLADGAGLLVDPDMAASRMRHILALAGIN